MNKRLFRILTFFAFANSSLLFGVDDLFIKIGYGGNWQFFNEKTYNYATPLSTGSSYPATTSSSNIAPADRLALGIDLKLTAMHALSGSFEVPVAYPQFPQRMGAVSYKFFPLDWYNAPFIGAGLNYFSLDLGDGTTAKRFGAQIIYGLNIQFPGNVFIIVDFKNVFFDSITNTQGNQTFTHFFILTGSVSYRIRLSG